MQLSYPEGYWRQIYDLDETVASKTTTEWIDAHEGERILDVGCGAGRFMIAFEEKGAFVVGVDPSIEALKLAKPRVGGGHTGLSRVPSLRYRSISVGPVII